MISILVLIFIPLAAKREEQLKSYYEATERGSRPEVVSPYPGFDVSYILNIDDTVLINSLKNIQFLSKAKKFVRKRGKIQLVEETQTAKVATGDSIRGQLHQETFYGVMKPAKLDSNGKLQRDENGKVIQEEKERYTIRVPFQYKKDATTPGVKSIDDIVDEGIKAQIRNLPGGLKEAFEKDFYLLDKKGQPHGNKIRHIRVWASVSEPLKIKKQTYLSSKEYKQYYYAANATNSYFALYEDEEKTKKDFDFRNLMEVAQSLAVDKIETEQDLFAPFITIKKGKVEKQLDLKCVLTPGVRVVFLKEQESKVVLTAEDIFNRLYVYTNFEKDGRLSFKYHLEARNKIEEEYLESVINWGKPNPTLRFSYSKYNFLVEGYDFTINMDGTINWK